MREIKSAWCLGAAMYMPAIRSDLSMILSRSKMISGNQQPRTIVICLEDAINHNQIDQALEQLELSLKLYKQNEQYVFVRPKNTEVLEKILKIDGIEKIDGFVIPKITDMNIRSYLRLLENRGFYIMPTLETKECFDIDKMKTLREYLLEVKDKILCLRIGGNDLLNTLNMRRPINGTLYNTPVGLVIHNLVQVFKPHGFNLSAPVFEFVDRMNLLEEEVQLDLMAGLVGKTAIHPSQISHIEKNFEVSEPDLEMAKAILDTNAPAVFQMHGAMCEPATHRMWATEILLKNDIYNN